MAGNQHLPGLDRQRSEKPRGPYEKPGHSSDETATAKNDEAPVVERKDTGTDSDDTDER